MGTARLCSGWPVVVETGDRRAILSGMTQAQVEVVEVSPRDGLQAEDVLLSTDAKVELINRAVDAGIRRVEVCSFVHPGRVPQMADAEAVLADVEDTVNSVLAGQPELADDTNERLSYSISAEDNKVAKVTMAWDKVRLSFLIDTQVDQKIADFKNAF